jgi:small subunit ribosomal protein S1
MEHVKKKTGHIAEDGTCRDDSMGATYADSQEALSGEQSETLSEPQERNSGNDFMALYEESLKDFQEGSIIGGEIVQVDEEYAVVDIGYKTEGRISLSEFRDSAGGVNLKLGDKIEVVLIRREDENGDIVLSKEKAESIKRWDEIQGIYGDGSTIKGKIISRVRGGFSVDVGVRAFLPASQVDRAPGRNVYELIGTEHEFKVVKYDKRRWNVVLSQRAVVEAEREVQRRQRLETLKQGDIIEGKVKNILHFGLFVDLGGIDGLVHISDITWGKAGNPTEGYQIGEQVKVKVLDIDRERQRISLGIKQLTSDPWTHAQERYPLGSKVKGTIADLKKYGAFVKLEEGIEGLVHTSEMSWTEKIYHPSRILNIGDTVEVMVVDIDAAKRQISLSMKRLEPNPWDSVAEHYPVGAVIEGEIKNVSEFGLFIGIDKGIDGLVHISDISWTKTPAHPSEIYKKGQWVKAVVLDIDKVNRRFSLGIKQLTTDPWDNVAERYKRGTEVTGVVKNIADFGVFAELEDGVVALMRVSEIPRKRGEDPLSRFEVGGVIKATVNAVQQEERKISLTMRKLRQSPRKDTKGGNAGTRGEVASNLGDLLKKEMEHVSNKGIED